LRHRQWADAPGFAPPQLSDLHDPVFIVNEWDVNRMLTFGPTFQRFTFTVLMGRMQVDFSP
jgi:hypothetical protein